MLSSTREIEGLLAAMPAGDNKRSEVPGTQAAAAPATKSISVNASASHIVQPDGYHLSLTLQIDKESLASAVESIQKRRSYIMQLLAEKQILHSALRENMASKVLTEKRVCAEYKLSIKFSDRERALEAAVAVAQQRAKVLAQQNQSQLGRLNNVYHDVKEHKQDDGEVVACANVVATYNLL
ncbi:uncharacterized protein MONBRDRAFT_28450 [Monosiga brevicollis MX1]|uniref:Uncharacterized protein n=1 Tax=Monosiga brevicollis TaxID=81824 RepID=A9V875_MONBE|nr:uncharacterized protein MONBRDRAFT_28450 [Monosiga brevicollis MX1]EDQ86289.1 predicted protein [Monosiga brevicollis MX1]|eukprot:XP_001748959.1 hypothetical protein [Monosiga brevicollis MX1]